MAARAMDFFVVEPSHQHSSYTIIFPSQLPACPKVTL
jgi:hypothetical protein